MRNAALLTAARDDPGPAGRLLFAHKKLATWKRAFSSKAVAEVADVLGSPGTIGSTRWARSSCVVFLGSVCWIEVKPHSLAMRFLKET